MAFPQRLLTCVKIIVLPLLGWMPKEEVFNQNISQLVYPDIFHDPLGFNLS